MQFEGDDVSDAFVRYARGPHSSPGLRAAFARTGLPDLEIRCAATNGGRSCDQELGGVWQTREGVVLAFNMRLPNAEQMIHDVKMANPGFRIHEELLWSKAHLLLDEANDVEVFCPRHGSWPLDLAAVRRRLHRGRVRRRRETLGTKPPTRR